MIDIVCHEALSLHSFRPKIRSANHLRISHTYTHYSPRFYCNVLKKKIREVLRLMNRSCPVRALQFRSVKPD